MIEEHKKISSADHRPSVAAMARNIGCSRSMLVFAGARGGKCSTKRLKKRGRYGTLAMIA